MLKKLREWWLDAVWVPFYVQHAHFHLYLHRSQRTPLVVYDRHCDPCEQIGEFRLVCSYWTPLGCRRGIEMESWWHGFMSSEAGREFREVVLNAKEPPHA